jgi:hypothetical protein
MLRALIATGDEVAAWVAAPAHVAKEFRPKWLNKKKAAYGIAHSALTSARRFESLMSTCVLGFPGNAA